MPAGTRGGRHLRDYWQVLVRRRWVVYLAVATVSAVALLGSFLVTPLYRATTTDRNEADHHLDLRLEKRWRPSWGTLAGYIDVQNVYDNRNQEGRVYKYDFSESRSIPGLSVFPSIGLRGEL